MMGMNKLTQENRQTLIFRLAFTSVIIASVIVLAVIGMEGFIRWVMNREFVVLGGHELETLTVFIGILILSMMYIYRPGEQQS